MEIYKFSRKKQGNSAKKAPYENGQILEKHFEKRLTNEDFFSIFI
jgi:hypothetical protein